MVKLRRHVSIGLARMAYAFHRLDVFQRVEWLRRTEEWTDRERADWRLERLNAMLDYAWKNIPFYRDYWASHGVRQGILKHVEELQSYPILEKETFRANWEKIRPENSNEIPHISKHTGGTTGSPVHYLLDKEQWAVMQAFHFWGWSRAGYAFGDPVGVLTGGSLIPDGVRLLERVRNFIEHRLFLFGVHMDRDLALDYHARLSRARVEYLYGYPSIIYLFCKFLEAENLRLPKLKAVVVTAEMLQAHYRQGIEKVLQCRVFNNYGCNDGGVESFECSIHKGLHYNDLQSIMEVDNHGLPKAGRLIITNLWNRSTPFIRYENGDNVLLAMGPCGCGAKFPVIETVEGRTTDILRFPNGQAFVCPPHLFGDMDIDGWQVVQTQPEKVEVRLAKNGIIDKGHLMRIEKVMRHHLSADIELEIKQVEKLKVTKGGKLKPVWSEVKP